MAFGFPAYHVEDVNLPLPVTDQWIGYAAQHSGLVFKGRQADATGWYWALAANMDLMTWGCDIKIWALSAQQVRIRSECALPTQCFDWGKNQDTVRRITGVLVSGMQQAYYGQQGGG